MAGMSAEVSLVVGEAQVLTTEGSISALAAGNQVLVGEQVLTGELGYIVMHMSDGLWVILGHGNHGNNDVHARVGQQSSGDVETLSGLQQGPDPHHALAVPHAIDHVLFLIEQSNGEIMGARLDYPANLAVCDSLHPRQYETIMGQLFDGQVETYFIKAGMHFYSDFGWPVDPLDPGLGAEGYLNVISSGPYAGSPLSFSGVEFSLLEGAQAFLLQDDGFTSAAVSASDISSSPDQVMQVIGVNTLGPLSTDDVLLHSESPSGRIDLDALLESSLGLQGKEVGESSVRITASESGALLEVNVGDAPGGFVALATLGNLSAGDHVILLFGGGEYSIAVS